MKNKILQIENLNVFFKLKRKKIHIIRGVDLDIYPGQIIGLVGESGSGKSVTTKSIININYGAITSADNMIVDGIDLQSIKKNKWSEVRGKLVSYVPQDPLTSLNPTRRVYKQLFDVLDIHRVKEFKTKEDKMKYAVELLETFGIRNAKKRIHDFPHAFSGGQRQRIIIAIAVASKPKLIIADEPTTALDPTVQAAVLELFDKIRNLYNTSILFISHNIAVVAKLCDYIYVMYAGRIVERGTKEEIFGNPKHPYTWALIAAIPEDSEKGELYTIPGTPPDMLHLPAGDPFAPRNEFAMKIDFSKEPPLFAVSKTHDAATWLLHPATPKQEIPKDIVGKIELFKRSFKNKKNKGVKNV